MMTVIKNLVPSNKYHIKCPYSMAPEFYVVHNTANDATARNEIAYMISNNLEISFHYAIDDKEVVQGILENRNAWHASDGGNGAGNRKGIAIEICYSLSGGDKFIAAEKRAAKFIAEGLSAKGWGIDRVKKHQDFTNKYCPHRTLDMGWQRFLDMIKAELNILNKPNGSDGTLSGIDIPRTTNALVLYFKGVSNNGKTGANQWGYEVQIDKNGVVLENPHYSGNTSIPKDGKVLSGHGEAGTWIYKNIKKGYVVWFENGKVQVGKNQHRSADVVNGIRAANYLAVYNKGDRATTNQWGYEVAIGRDGKATSNPVYGVGSMTIPAGGFVVSGHGEAGKWIYTNIKKGTTVTFDGKVVVVK